MNLKDKQVIITLQMISCDEYGNDCNPMYKTSICVADYDTDRIRAIAIAHFIAKECRGTLAGMSRVANGECFNISIANGSIEPERTLTIDDMFFIEGIEGRAYCEQYVDDMIKHRSEGRQRQRGR